MATKIPQSGRPARLAARAVLFVAAIIAVAASATMTPWPAHAQATLVVDDDGRAAATNCDDNGRAFGSIQAAVNAAQPGSAILICPGTYAEQVTITKNDLTLRGSGQGVTVLRPGAVPATVPGLLLPYPIAPILLVNGATGVTISRLTIDGSVAESGASTLFCPEVGFYVGVYFRNASGTVDSAQVTKVNSSTRCSNGVRSESGSTGESNLAVTNSLIDQNGNFGALCIGPNAACSLTGNTVRGRGSVTDQIQAGIAIRAGATATIIGNTIRDHTYALAQGVPSKSVGVFLVNADPKVNPHLLQENSFVNNDLNVQRVSSEQALH